MTPDEAGNKFRSEYALRNGEFPDFIEGWHAALAYAAGELRNWAEGKASNSASTALMKAADRLSPPAAP